MLRLPYSWRKKEGIPSRVPKLGGLRYRIDCLLENLFIRLCPFPKEGINSKNVRNEKIIVSLTSFPERIDKAYYAIKSIMLQTVKADRIILWLADSQFEGRSLPKKITFLEEKGLTVKWCDDLKSHKKYYYVLQAQKENEIVITYDDDIIYESDSIEKLVRKHEMYPAAIVCNRAHEIIFDEHGNLCPYKSWKICSSYGVDKPERFLLPSTGAGCLYPYACMPKETFDWGLIKSNAMSADDIWMRFCSLKNGIYVVKTLENYATLCVVYGSQEKSLTKQNDINGENQRVIERLVSLFFDIEA